MILSCSITVAQSYIVDNFNNAIQNYKGTNDIETRDKIVKTMCMPGALVNNELRKLICKEQAENCFINKYIDGFTKLGKYLYQYTKAEQCDLKSPFLRKEVAPDWFKFQYTCSFGNSKVQETNYCQLKDGKIWCIYSALSPEMHATELYSQKRYREALVEFKKIMEVERNGETYYYSYPLFCYTIMLINKEGCEFMTNKSRKQELTRILKIGHSIYKGGAHSYYWSKMEELYNLYL